MEKVVYKLQTIMGGKNPRECQITEEFRGNTQPLVRIIMDKVPLKPLYVIFKQKNGYFLDVLDTYSNIKCGSDKVLEEALKYAQKRIDVDVEKNPLLIESVIEDCTNYGWERFNRVKNRLEKCV